MKADEPSVRRPPEVEAEEILAVSRRALHACAAVTTGAVGQKHPVSGGEVDDAGPHLLDDASTFVSEDGRQRSGIPLVADDGVCVADARSDHANAEFIGAKLVDLHLHEGQRGLGGGGDGGSGLHGSPPWVLRFGGDASCFSPSLVTGAWPGWASD